MSEWHKADQQNLATYRRFSRLTVVSMAVVIVALIVMALTLL
ncbi:MAG: hypothetical protein ACREER_01170 [Alphaproteobacteria bacterium]